MNDLIEEITKFINEKIVERDKIQSKLTEIQNKFNEVDEEIKAAEIFQKSIEKKHELPKQETLMYESKISENQELIETLKKKRKQNITQVEAIEFVARHIMDENKKFRVVDIRDIMKAAGFFIKNPAKAYNTLSTPLRRSNKFKYIEAGSYKLSENENNND